MPCFRKLTQSHTAQSGSGPAISDPSVHLKLVVCKLFLDFNIYSIELKNYSVELKLSDDVFGFISCFFSVLFYTMRLQRRLSDEIFQTQLLQDCSYWFVE